MACRGGGRGRLRANGSAAAILLVFWAAPVPAAGPAAARDSLRDALDAYIRAERAAERPSADDATLALRDQKREIYRQARRRFVAATGARARVRRIALDRLGIVSAMAVVEANRVRALRTIAAGVDAGHGGALRGHLRRLRQLLRAEDPATVAARWEETGDEAATLLARAARADGEEGGARLRAWLAPYRYLLDAAYRFAQRPPRPERLEAPLRPVDRARLADTAGLIALLADVPGLPESERRRLERALLEDLPVDPIDENAATENLRALQVAALRDEEIRSDRAERWDLPHPGGPFGRIVPYPRVFVASAAYGRGQRVRVDVIASDTYASDATLYLVPADSPRGDPRATERNSMETRLIGRVYATRVFFTAPAVPGRYSVRLHDTQRSGRAREVAWSRNFAVR